MNKSQPSIEPDAENSPEPIGGEVSRMGKIIPKPVSVRLGEGRFTLLPQAKIHIEPDTAEVRAIAGYLADRLAPATGFPLPIAPTGSPLAPGDLRLTASDADPSLGEEGYELSITPDHARLAAYRPAGLFHGVQNSPPAAAGGHREPAEAGGRVVHSNRFDPRYAQVCLARRHAGCRPALLLQSMTSSDISTCWRTINSIPCTCI